MIDKFKGYMLKGNANSQTKKNHIWVKNSKLSIKDQQSKPKRHKVKYYF